MRELRRDVSATSLFQRNRSLLATSMHITLGGTQISKHPNELIPLSTGPTRTTFNSSMKRIPPHTTTEMEQAPPFLTLPLQYQHQQNRLLVRQWMMRQLLGQTMRSFALSSVHQQLRTLPPTLYASNSTSKMQTGHNSTTHFKTLHQMPSSKCNNNSSLYQVLALNRHLQSYAILFS